MGKLTNFSRPQRSEKLKAEKSVDLSEGKSLSSKASDKVKPKAEGQEIKRREFLKLSAMMAGGGLAAIILEGPLKPLTSLPKASQILGGSQRGASK